MNRLLKWVNSSFRIVASSFDAWKDLFREEKKYTAINNVFFHIQMSPNGNSIAPWDQYLYFNNLKKDIDPEDWFEFVWSNAYR